MARGRSTRSAATLAAPPPPPRPSGSARLSRLERELAAITAELPSSRLLWCPQEHSGEPGLGEQARRHEALVRRAGALIERAARDHAAAGIAALAAQLRALEAAESANGGPDPETDARRRRIMEHEIPALRQASLQGVLARCRPFGAPPGSRAVHRFEDGSDSAARERVEEAADLFPRAWLARSRADSALVPFRAVLGQKPGRPRPRGWRGSYEHSAQRSVLRLDEASVASPRGREYAAHELTHRLEALVPGLERLAWAFRERAREDDADTSGRDAYAMRVYQDEGPGAVSELLAVGVQALAASPARFDRVLGQDADYRQFVLGVLVLT